MPQRQDEQLERYLLSGERIVVAVHRHWATVAEPVATAVAFLLLAAVVSVRISPSAGQLADLLWWVWFAMVGRALFYLYEWRHEWFIATDRRLLLIYGFIVRKVDMMPLTKVTDMTYHRTVAGRLLGYGTFVLESAGQDQALSKVAFVPHPDRTYQSIIAQIFHREGDAQHGDDEDYPDDDPDPRRRPSWASRFARWMPGGAPQEPEYLNTTLDRGRTRVRPQRDERDRRDDDPDTEDLWPKGGLDDTPGETLYRSDAGSSSPVEDYRDDTTGFWRPR